jgi:methyltransferase (TIGR00027 family)
MDVHSFIVGGMLNRASRTAEQVALFRALESARRRDKVFDDPYASKFLPPRYRLLARLARVPAIRRRVERHIDTRFPAGPRASAVVRTRLIDDLVGDALAAGIEQVVLLGAGYDSRAHRLPGIERVPVHEVDHPATQASKRRRIRAHVRPAARGHVRFVPVDLMRDDLADALLRAGFATDERAVVVWEGGGRLVVTYVDRSALDGTGGFSGVEEWHAAVRRHGEPWTFGFDPVELPGYLAERGMTLTQDISTRDAAARYLAPLRRDEPAAAFYRIACAEFRRDAA